MQSDEAPKIPHRSPSIVAANTRARSRARKRTSVAALLKAAAEAGLKVAAIECTEESVKLIVRDRTAIRSDDDELVLDRVMTEQMGVTRLGGRKRR